MSFTFRFEDFASVSQECLNAFSHDIEITALIHAIKEILLAGKKEYECTDGMHLLPHNKYGFRVLAAETGANMIKIMANEESAVKEFITSEILFKKRDIEETVKSKMWRDLPRKEESINNKEVAIRNWFKFWNLNSAKDVNLKEIYYHK